MKFDHVLRSILPRRVISAIRLLQIFQHKHGHTFQQSGFPIDGKGDFQPWLTYPMIEFLNGLDLSAKRVFEFGAGSSTLYWASRAEQVVSVEMNQVWYELLLPKIPSNVELIRESDGGKYAAIIKEMGKFDVIVIDGAERYLSAYAAYQALVPGGMIILDNAEWYPNTAEYLNSLGLIEIPFNGFSPVNAFTSTSTAFITREFTITQNNEARQPPIGGRSLPVPALDDVGRD